MFFPTTSYLFRFWSSSRKKWVVKVGLKVQTLRPFLFYEKSDPSNFFQTFFFFFARLLSLVRISAMLGHIWESKGPKSSQKELFMDVESIRKTLKTFNLTTTAILMQLTTIMYLDESVNRKPLRVRNSVFLS